METPLQGKPPGSFTPVRFVRSRAIGDGEEPTSRYCQGMTEWRESIREQLAQLERQRSRLEAQASARLREIEQRITDLRASLQ